MHKNRVARWNIECSFKFAFHVNILQTIYCLSEIQIWLGILYIYLLSQATKIVLFIKNLYLNIITLHNFFLFFLKFYRIKLCTSIRFSCYELSPFCLCVYYCINNSKNYDSGKKKKKTTWLLIWHNFFSWVLYHLFMA